MSISQTDVDAALDDLKIAINALSSVIPAAQMVGPLIAIGKMVFDAIEKAEELAAQTAVKAVDVAVDAAEDKKFPVST